MRSKALLIELSTTPSLFRSICRMQTCGHRLRVLAAKLFSSHLIFKFGRLLTNQSIEYITANYKTQHGCYAVVKLAFSKKSDIDENQQLVVTLFADVHGYSRLMEENELETIERVSQSIQLIRDLIVDYGGKVLNISGDGVLAIFDNADRALVFAVELQKELAQAEVWTSHKDPITFRIGIAVGITYMRDNVLHGNSVNIAARIQELAEPGGICITGQLLNSLQNRGKYIIEYLGKRALKNILLPVEIFNVLGQMAEDTLVRPLADYRVGEKVPTNPDGLDRPDASLVVLPLENLSEEKKDLHFCNGIVSDIIKNLTRFRRLNVTARQSSFYIYSQTKSLREIGRQLGVRYAMTGGFRRNGRRLRINFELSECESDRTIWSETYDGVTDDIFEFEDEVTNTAASRLMVQIDNAEQRRYGDSKGPRLDAYGLILRGEDMSFRFRQESNYHARRLFMQAREIDPQYGRTYSAIARTFNYEWRYSWTADRDAALNRALELARDAIEYDAMDARGYSELGFALIYGKQHDEAVAAYERATELNPNDADILAEMGDCLVYVGEAERSIKLLNKAIRLNPFHPDHYYLYLADAYFHLEDYEATIRTLLNMRDQSEGQRLMASSYALLGDLKKARYHAHEVMKVHPNFTVKDWRQVPPNKYPEDLEKFVHGLRLSGLN